MSRASAEGRTLYVEGRTLYVEMPTLVPDPLPVEVEALLERRREWGADRHDEVWEGVLHMSPPAAPGHELIVMQLAVILDPLTRGKDLAVLGAAGIGVPDDHRVPDMTLLRPPATQWNQTAALAFEILSWREPATKKLPFYAAHGVEEVVIIDPDTRGVQWLALVRGAYQPVDHSAVIELGPEQLAELIDWDSFPVS